MLSADFCDVTIILFTRNRSRKAITVIDFWLSRGAQIIILDASDNSSWASKYLRDRNVVYFKEFSFAARALIASNQIRTKYSIIHSDDCLVLPDGVLSGVSWLEQHKNFGFVYSSGNFTSWYVESTLRQFQRKIVGEKPIDRMYSWAKHPSDVMWGAIWRSCFLEKALKIWGKSTEIFPFESALHTTSLYLAGSGLTSGSSMYDVIHLTRHWDAPIDSTLKNARLELNPLGINLHNHVHFKLFEEWKILLLDNLNKELLEADRISLTQLERLIDLYQRNEPNLGKKFTGNRLYFQRVREKYILVITSLANGTSILSTVAYLLCRLREKGKLYLNYVLKRRKAWYRSDLLKQLTSNEIRAFGLQTSKFQATHLVNYSKLFGQEK